MIKAGVIDKENGNSCAPCGEPPPTFRHAVVKKINPAYLKEYDHKFRWDVLPWDISRKNIIAGLLLVGIEGPFISISHWGMF